MLSINSPGARTLPTPRGRSRSHLIRARAAASLLGALILCLITVAARTAAAQSNAVDVSAYPADMQRAYRSFSMKCSRCHALAKPLAASYSTDQGWQDVIRRMARMPGAAISSADQDEIRRFLVFHGRVRSGQQKLTPAPTGSTEPKSGAVAGPEPVVVTQDGVRIEVLAREPVSLRFPSAKDALAASLRGDETLYLVVRLLDDETRALLPYARVNARILGGAIESACELVPAIGPDGFHYGANLVAPPGKLRIELVVDPPNLAVFGSTKLKLTRSTTFQVELQRK